MSHIIGISGGSGSGKTTFIKMLREQFNENELCIISQDNYYKPKEQQVVDENGIENFDLPGAINIAAQAADIETLKKGKQVILKEYTFNNEHILAKEIILKPAPLILVEGIFISCFEELRKLCDITIYFHTHENLKLIRRIKRDSQERNRPIDDVMYRYEHHVIPCFKKYIEPYIDQSDIVINNHKSFDKAFQVVSGYLKHRLG